MPIIKLLTSAVALKTIGTIEPYHQPPKRVRNAEVRAREYLTNAEVGRLMKAAGANRNGHRDSAMVLLAYRHGLRPVELVTLRWDAIDFAHGQMHVEPSQKRITHQFTH
jgi:integrase